MTKTTRKSWHRPGLPAWLAVSFAVCLLVGLGIWQLQRLEHKESLIAEIAAGVDGKPGNVLPYSAPHLRSRGFYRYHVTGELLHEHEMHLAARYHQSILGYHLLTPLKLRDGRILLVNRGWVPAALKEPASRPDSVVWGMQHYTVMLRTDRDHTYFTPEHDIANNIWFWRDIEAMREHTGLPLLPVSADIVMEHVDETQLPVASTGEIRLRNDHLGYAVTWFMLACAAAAVFVAYHWHREES